MSPAGVEIRCVRSRSYLLSTGERHPWHQGGPSAPPSPSASSCVRVSFFLNVFRPGTRGEPGLPHSDPRAPAGVRVPVLPRMRVGGTERGGRLAEAPQPGSRGPGVQERRELGANCGEVCCPEGLARRRSLPEAGGPRGLFTEGLFRKGPRQARGPDWSDTGPAPGELVASWPGGTRGLPLQCPLAGSVWNISLWPS